MTILPAATNPAAATPRMRQAAQQFEGQVLSLMLQPIFAAASNARSAFGGGAAEAQWQPMMTEAYANRMAQAGGLGLRDMVLAHMIRIQESQQTTQETRP